MVIFMGNSEPSQRFVFGLNFVKFTFLKGRKAKSNPGWAVSFSTCMEQAGMGTTGLLHLPSSASLSQQKLKASLWQTGLCCSLPFCSKLKDVPYLLPLLLSILFLMQPPFSAALFPVLHPMVAPFIPPHPLQLTSYTCGSVLQFWANLASFAQLFVVTTAWILME